MFVVEMFAVVTVLVFLMTCVAFAMRAVREAAESRGDYVNLDPARGEVATEYEFISLKTISLLEPEEYGVMYRKIIRDNGIIADDARMWDDLGFCEYVAEMAFEDRNWNGIYSEDWKFYDRIYKHVTLRAFGVVTYA